jgi:MauM/NapG family ferredoxin protein
MLMKPVVTRRFRRAAQVISFLFFLVLAVYSAASLGSLLSWELALRVDPFAAFTTMIAQRRWLVFFLPAAATLVATLLLGRFWCGWLCPLGTLLDWFALRKAADKGIQSPWRGFKYGILFVTVFAAIWGNLTLLIFDPLTIWMRALATAILPGFTWLITQFERVLYPLAFLRAPLYAADSALRGSWLGVSQAFFGAGAVTVGLLLAIIVFNLVRRRAWCRYVCPLGGMLSLVAKAAWLKRSVSSACTSCGACAKTCRMGTITPKKAFASDSGECILCMDCAVICPTQAISFERVLHLDNGWSYDPNRRQVLGALGVSLSGLALLKIVPSRRQPNIRRLRPPRADEETLLSACIRCGACLRICPSQGLQPSLLEAGLEGIGTPILVPRLGNCVYTCTACGTICPTGAIPRVTPAIKYSIPIGKAYVDQALCLPWSGRAPCIVCEEVCPVPHKAITLTNRPALDIESNAITLQAPVMQYDRCVGCGLCELKCPVKGEAAIRVRLDPLS